MLNKAAVGCAIWFSTRRKLRIALGFKGRQPKWPPQSFDATVAHQAELASFLLKHLPAEWSFAGRTACEVGCSDCFSLASLLFRLGCKHVDLIEPSPPILNPLQPRVLREVQHKGVDLDPTILIEGAGGVCLDETKVTYRNTLMEQAPLAEAYDFIFSFDVMEHVEDLQGCYGSCSRALKKGGGRMFHRIDFSGHGDLEDPVPPLDFQTYPDWLYSLMSPRAYRATRSFVSDHHFALKNAGLQVDETRVTRSADPQYLENIWPKLRKQARAIPKPELGVLEAIIFSHKE